MTEVQQVLDVLLRLAAGDLDARVDQPEADSPMDLVALGVNMLAEELAGSITAERALRASLEAEVAQRSAEVEALERAHARIAAQTEVIRELSTPVIEILDGVLILPLIGVIDRERGEQILDQLLDAIARMSGRIVIVDVTGVPSLDLTAAERLLEVMAAARLLGATAIVTGVSPASAKALVELGVDLSPIVAAGSLEAGLRRALALTGRRIGKIATSSP